MQKAKEDGSGARNMHQVEDKTIGEYLVAVVEWFVKNMLVLITERTSKGKAREVPRIIHYSLANW